MSDGTKIEWADATWNVVNGCSVLSPGCTNCYAMRLAGTRLKHHASREGLTIDTKAGPVWNGQVRFNDKVLLDPLKWKRPRKIFVCAHGDLFHDHVPDEWLDQVFAVMALAPQHVFQLLTKRPERMRDYLLADRRDEMNSHAGTMMHWNDMPSADWPLPNVWLGVSAEDQSRADQRIPALLGTPAVVRWISAEPLLGPIDIEAAARRAPTIANEAPWWVVVGGESGPGARPMHPNWARSLRDQCAAADVPFLFKQWGGWSPAHAAGIGGISMSEGNSPGGIAWPDGTVGHGRAEDHGGPGIMLTNWHHKRDAGRMLDGVQHDGYPA